MRNTLSKNTHLLLLIIGLVFSFHGNAQIISQYVETDSGNTPKGIEIWNNTGAVLDFSNSSLEIQQGTNGDNLSTLVTVSTGNLLPDEVMVIGTGDIGTYLTTEGISVTFIQYGFAFNGNDALAVLYGGNITDVFGEPGNVPGSSWSGNGVSTQNQNIELKPGITTGSLTGFTDPSIRFSTVNSSPSGPNGLAGFGIAPLFSGNFPPSITNITLTPATVTSTDMVSISADISDSDGIGSVSLDWGTSSGNLSNSIVMGLAIGDTYTTVSDIPAQADGTTVYYEITATDSNASPATSTSGELSYTVQDPQPGGWQITAEDTLFTIDFETTVPGVNEGKFTGAGFGPTPSAGQLDSDSWSVSGMSDGDLVFGATEYSGDFARGDSPGGVGTGGIYSFETSTGNSSLGVQPGGNDFTPGSITLKLQNQTGNIINSMIISYDIFVYNDQDRGSSFNFSHSPDNVTFINETDADFSSEQSADSIPIWEHHPRLVELSGLSIAPSGYYYLHWTSDDIDGSGSRDELALDNISLVANEAITNYVYNGSSWSPANPNGAATLNDNINVQSGTTSLTSNLQITNLVVDAGAVLEIENALTLEGDLNNNGSIIFINDANKLGQLGEFSGNISGSGSVTTQRYIPAKRAFRFVTSAVNSTASIHDNWQEGATSGTDNPAPGFGTHITGSTTGANGFDATATGSPSMYGFDNIAQSWDSGINNTDINTLNAGEPWYLLIRGDRSTDLTTNNPTATPTVLRATGDLVTGDYAYTNLSQSANGFNFIGNPYQAIVDMNKVLENSTNLNNAYYYLWDPNINEYGSYVLVELPNGNTVPEGAGSSGANQFLQPGQAAFVSTLSNGPASLLFEESDKAVAQNPTPVFKPSGAAASISASLYESNSFGNGGNPLDGVLVKFSPNGNNGIDFRDAPKAFNIDENVSLLNNMGYFIMENKAMPTPADEIQLYNHNYRHTDYVFQIKATGLEDVTAYLSDAYLGTQTQLTPGTNQVNFNVDQSIAGSIDPARFSIVFKTLSINDSGQTGFAVYPNPVKNGWFFISLPGISDPKIKLSLHDLAGRLISDMEFTNDANNPIPVFTEQLSPGIYMLHISTSSGEGFTQKIIIEN